MRVCRSPEIFSARGARSHNREEHVMCEGGVHDSRNLTCTSCHAIHTAKIRDGAARRGHGHRDVRPVPPRQVHEDPTRVADARRGRQARVQHLSQSARLDERAAGGEGEHGERVLHELSCGEARPVPVGASGRSMASFGTIDFGVRAADISGDPGSKRCGGAACRGAREHPAAGFPSRHANAPAASGGEERKTALTTRVVWHRDCTQYL